MRGSVENKSVKVASDVKAYVFYMVDGEVGMYAVKLTDGAFLNNANKAYLFLCISDLVISDKTWDTSAGGQLSNGFRFDFGGTTGIGEVSGKVKGEGGVVKFIFDLCGRGIDEITAPGIYIVNGKKMLVK